jgi:hypothetical protein
MPSLSEAIVKLPPHSAITFNARTRTRPSTPRFPGPRSRFVMTLLLSAQSHSCTLGAGGSEAGNSRSLMRYPLRHLMSRDPRKKIVGDSLAAPSDVLIRANEC